LAGLVERVTFHSAETGFCVLRVKVRGHRDLVTVLGSAADVHAGESIQASGHWEQHRDHGLQFRASFLQVVRCTRSTESARRVLAASQQLSEQKGHSRDHGVPTEPRRRHGSLGAHLQSYGADAVPLVRENPYRLARDIRGIGFKTADQIAQRLGIPKTSMLRARAGFSYALLEAIENGDCGLHRRTC
jgi:exodeoxyribonuclease V alpha subunit